MATKTGQSRFKPGKVRARYGEARFKSGKVRARYG